MSESENNLTSIQRWYAQHKGVDWELMAERREEYYRTGTTRAYLKLVRMLKDEE